MLTAGRIFRMGVTAGNTINNELTTTVHIAVKGVVNENFGITKSSTVIRL